MSSHRAVRHGSLYRDDSGRGHLRDLVGELELAMKLSMPSALLDHPPHGAPSSDRTPLIALPAISEQSYRDIRRRMVLDCCKWDPQVGDFSTLAPFALLM